MNLSICTPQHPPTYIFTFASPTQDANLFQPQMSARAAKLALDNVVKRTGSILASM